MDTTYLELLPQDMKQEIYKNIDRPTLRSLVMTSKLLNTESQQDYYDRQCMYLGYRPRELYDYIQNSEGKIITSIICLNDAEGKHSVNILTLDPQDDNSNYSTGVLENQAIMGNPTRKQLRLSNRGSASDILLMNISEVQPYIEDEFRYYKFKTRPIMNMTQNNIPDLYTLYIIAIDRSVCNDYNESYVENFIRTFVKDFFQYHKESPVIQLAFLIISLIPYFTTLPVDATRVDHKTQWLQYLSSVSELHENRYDNAFTGETYQSKIKSIYNNIENLEGMLSRAFATEFNILLDDVF
jgi:hypothetical protein